MAIKIYEYDASKDDLRKQPNFKLILSLFDYFKDYN